MPGSHQPPISSRRPSSSTSSAVAAWMWPASSPSRADRSSTSVRTTDGPSLGVGVADMCASLANTCTQHKLLYLIFCCSSVAGHAQRWTPAVLPPAGVSDIGRNRTQCFELCNRRAVGIRAIVRADPGMADTRIPTVPSGSRVERTAGLRSLAARLVGRITALEWIIGGLVAALMLVLVVIEPDILEAPVENWRTIVFTVGGTIAAAIALAVMLWLKVPAILRIAVLW